MKKDIKNDLNPTNKTDGEQDIVGDSIGVGTTSGNKQNGELESCQKEVQELKDKFVRVTADLQNFQARVTKERAAWALEARVEIIKNVLAIVDDFERALAEQRKHENAEFGAWLAGFELIGKRMTKLITDYGVTEVDCSGMFDPQKHEALMQVVDSQKKSGEIVAVLQKGYQVNDTVIRPAKVSVAQ